MSNVSTSPRCPACADQVLAPVRDHEIDLDECPACKGRWFDRGELERALAAAVPEVTGDGAHPARSTHAAATGGYRNCPRCDQPMLRKVYERYSGVLVEWCGRHGYWLDAGEVEKAAAFVASGGQRFRARREMEELREQRERADLAAARHASASGYHEADWHPSTTGKGLIADWFGRWLVTR
jgi:Zn-finger nucleic acid-binding protein